MSGKMVEEALVLSSRAVGRMAGMMARRRIPAEDLKKASSELEAAAETTKAILTERGDAG